MEKLAFRLRLRRTEGLIPEDPQSMLTVTFDHRVLPKNYSLCWRVYIIFFYANITSSVFYE